MTMNEQETAVESLEQFNCRYICTLCNPFKQIDANRYGNLETHYLIQHKDQEVTTCPYCLSPVQISSISSHINTHFKKELKNPYFCPLCPISKPTLKCLAHHAFDEHQVTNIDLFRKCGHCEKLTRDVSDLINHLDSAKITLYHCTFPGCIVKSKSSDAVKSHVIRCHQADVNSVSHSIDFICSWPLQQQPLVEASALNLPSQFNGISNPSDQAISLSCPHCPFITVNMEKFAQHLATCKTAIKAGNFLSITCILFKCPVCTKSSTSTDMIKEHLINIHNQKDYDKPLSHEELTVPIDEVLAKEASMSFLSGTFNGKGLGDGVFSNLGDLDSIKALLDIVNPSNVNNSLNNSNASLLNSIKKEPDCENVSMPGELLKTQTTGKTILPTHLTNGQPVEEWVDLFFHETEFLAAFHKTKLTSDLQDFTDARLPEILTKLKHFGTLKVPIMGRANQRRVAACPVCNKNFNHGFSDLKKHLMVGHMEMSREISRFAINFTHSPKFTTIQIPNIHKNIGGQMGMKNINNGLTNANNVVKSFDPNILLNHNLNNGTNTDNNTTTVNGSLIGLAKLPPLDPVAALDQLQNMPPISSELECQDVKNHVDASTIEEAESLRPPGRGGIVPLDENGQPLKAALEATKSEEEIASFDVFKPVLGRQRIALAYSMGVLKKLFEDYTYSYSEKLHIINRLNRYSRMYVFMDMSAQGMNHRRYCCAVCSYNSQHSLADVRKHVMGSHCGISPKRFRICLRSSRHESTHFRLCSDEKMLQYVDLRTSKFNNTLSSLNSIDSSRLSNSTSMLNGSDLPSTVDTITRPNSNNNLNNNSNPSSNKTLNDDEEFNDEFASETINTNNNSINNNNNNNSSIFSSSANITASSIVPTKSSLNFDGYMVNHANEANLSTLHNSSSTTTTTSNTNATTSINGTSSHQLNGSNSLHSTPTSSVKDDLNNLLMEQSKLTCHMNNPYEGNEFLSHNGTPILLREGETGQRIDLPWSENVLLALMNNDRYKPHLNVVLKKMSIYANYHLIIVYKDRRIHAYICVCGRRFSVVREDEDNEMRPASLADCRRHVLGVHARVSQDMLTLCCQASRISRESNYQLYADKSLLALAEHHKIRTSKGSLSNMDLSNLSARSDLNSTINDSNNNSSTSVQRHPGTSLKATSLLTLDQGKELVSKYGLPEHWRLERIVNLVYSPDVFNQLLNRTMHYDDDFISGLHEKMKVYCDYSVYIFRQDTTKQKNQKFYACSACLSASPHGLGDMRKHILGVHAHIPEKIKAAAMAAGRLNRDNFGLYSDEQLLSMALMGGRSMTNSSSGKVPPLPMLNQSFASNSLTEELKSLSSSMVSIRKREHEPDVPLMSLSTYNFDNNNSIKKIRQETDSPSSSSIKTNDNTSNTGVESYQSVWPGQQTEDELAANELSNEVDENDDISKYSADYEKSLEDPQSDDDSQLMMMNPLEIDDTIPTPAPSEEEAHFEKRPPIILNLKLSKLNGNPTSTSNHNHNGNSSASSPYLNDDGESAQYETSSSSRSRRSIMLKSKKPLSTSN